MNISDEERFHELAHKALANEAQPAEQQLFEPSEMLRPKLSAHSPSMSRRISWILS